MRRAPTPIRRCARALAAALLAAIALAACGSSASSSSSSTSSSASSSAATSTSSGTSSAAATSSGRQIGFEGIPLEQGPSIGSAATTGTGKVDGIACGPTEQLAYHIHAHLAVFVKGRQYSLPAGIGIPGSSVAQSAQGPVAQGGSCIYWLHTHAPDGVIHIESPTQRIYTLGNFFDEWRQPLSTNQAGQVHGPITAFLNGKLWKKSLRAIPLLSHAVIQFDVGEPAPPLQSVNWAGTQL